MNFNNCSCLIFEPKMSYLCVKNVISKDRILISKSMRDVISPVVDFTYWKGEL